MPYPAYHPFSSARARDRYLRRYDERGRDWPVACETRTVETPAGLTFLRVSGPADAAPLVLLPSATSSSLFWIPNIETLSRSLRVYALDNIYDVGRSVYRKACKEPGDYTRWLDEVLEALGLRQKVSLAGLSYGAWIASQYALRFPQRLRAVVLAAPPATVQQLPASWAWHGITGLLPHRYFLRNMMRWMFPALSKRTDRASVELAETLLEDCFVALRCFKLKMPVAPTVLTDEQLRQLSEVPTLFLVGEHEVLYPAQTAVKRLNDVAPAIRTRIIPDAGHDLTIVQAARFNELLLQFVAEHP